VSHISKAGSTAQVTMQVKHMLLVQQMHMDVAEMWHPSKSFSYLTAVWSRSGQGPAMFM
jgi:hypothetical protein